MIARIFNVYGPGMRSDDGRVVPTFISQALAGQPLTVAGDGLQTRSLCYVDDLVTGLIALLHHDTAGPVNLGNPEEVTMIDLATMICRLATTPERITFRPLPPDDPTRRCPDTGLATRLLGWSPTVGLCDGLGRTIDWFRSDEIV